MKGKGSRRVKKVSIGGGKWSLKYKRSINCNRPKGFFSKNNIVKKRGKLVRKRSELGENKLI